MSDALDEKDRLFGVGKAAMPSDSWWIGLGPEQFYDRVRAQANRIRHSRFGADVKNASLGRTERDDREDVYRKGRQAIIEEKLKWAQPNGNPMKTTSPRS